MRRLLAVLAVAALVALAAPFARAAEPMPHLGRVLIANHGDVTIPAGDQADLVVVVSGSADIAGDVNTIVIVDGTANLVGAEAESVVAVRSQVEVGPGTVVRGEVMRLDAAVHQSGDADIRGGVTDLATRFTELGVVLAPALFLLWLGFGLATIVAALFVAAIGGRQLRSAELLLRDAPVLSFAIGLGGAILLPIAGVVLIATIIGAPLGLGLLVGVLPLLAFVGYLVAATWIGEWIVRRTVAGAPPERPIVAAVVGVLVLEAVSLVPVLTLLTGLASLLGFGAALRLAFRALRGESVAAMAAPRHTLAAPTGA